MGAFPCRVDGADASVVVADSALVIGDRQVAHVDIDAVTVTDHRITLRLADGGEVLVSHLARRTDEFARVFREARAAARRAALLQWTIEPPIDTYPMRVDGEEGQVVLFPDGVTVETLNGVPRVAPLGLVERVERDGWTTTLWLRGLDPVVVPPLARRTDEFLVDLEAARASLAARLGTALARRSDALAGTSLVDGWAVGPSHPAWSPLRATIAAEDADRVALLESAAGAGGEVRYGVKLVGEELLPFALVGVGDRVAVEGFGEEARATYVFRGPLERINAVLLVTSFRREALYLPEDQLGRWAVAVRLLDVVREARAALVARVVHGPAWADQLRAALR